MLGLVMMKLAEKSDYLSFFLSLGCNP